MSHLLQQKKSLWFHPYATAHSNQHHVQHHIFGFNPVVCGWQPFHGVGWSGYCAAASNEESTPTASSMFFWLLMLTNGFQEVFVHVFADAGSHRWNIPELTKFGLVCEGNCMCVDAYVCVCMCLSCCNATTSVVVCGMIGGVVRSIHTSRSGELGPLDRRYLCSL